MAATSKMSRVAEIFLDAPYVIALASKTDLHQARARPSKVPCGQEATEKIAELGLRRDDFHGEWNYTIFPREKN